VPTIISRPTERVLDIPWVKFLALVWPFIVAAVIMGIFFQPEGAETLTEQVWIPSGAKTVQVKRVDIEGVKSVSLEEFRQLGVENPLIFMDNNPSLGLDILYLGLENGNSYKAKATVAEPSYGQWISDYEINLGGPHNR